MWMPCVCCELALAYTRLPLHCAFAHLELFFFSICMSRAHSLFQAKLTHHCNGATLLFPAVGNLSSQDALGTLF